MVNRLLCRAKNDREWVWEVNTIAFVLREFTFAPYMSTKANSKWNKQKYDIFGRAMVLEIGRSSHSYTLTHAATIVSRFGIYGELVGVSFYPEVTSVALKRLRLLGIFSHHSNWLSFPFIRTRWQFLSIRPSILRFLFHFIYRMHQVISTLTFVMLFNFVCHPCVSVTSPLYDSKMQTQ